MRVFSVTAVAQRVAGLCAPQERAWICLQNDSDVDFFVSFDGSGVALTPDNGMRLPAGGQLTLENAGGVGWKANLEIWAVHSGAGEKVLRIQERAMQGYVLVGVGEG